MQLNTCPNQINHKTIEQRTTEIAFPTATNMNLLNFNWLRKSTYSDFFKDKENITFKVFNRQSPIELQLPLGYLLKLMMVQFVFFV